MMSTWSRITTMVFSFLHHWMHRESDPLHDRRMLKNLLLCISLMIARYGTSKRDFKHTFVESTLPKYCMAIPLSIHSIDIPVHSAWRSTRIAPPSLVTSTRNTQKNKTKQQIKYLDQKKINSLAMTIYWFSKMKIQFVKLITNKKILYND